MYSQLSNDKITTNANKFFLFVTDKLNATINTNNMTIKSLENNEEFALEKVNYLEIFLTKYLLVLVAVYLVFDIGITYVTILSLAISSFSYFFIKNHFFRNKTVFIYSLMLIIISLMIAMIVNFELIKEYKIITMLNFVIQYFIVIYLLEMMYIDLVEKQLFEETYKIKKKFLSYIYVEKTKNLNYFKYFLYVISALSATFGLVDLAATIVINSK